MISEAELKKILAGCIKNDLNAQELLYRKLYGFAMAICLRYAANRFEARVIINDGFLKVFNNLSKYDTEKPFLPWVARIMSNTSIDYYRSEIKRMTTVDIADMDNIAELPVVEHKLNYEELLSLVQQLPASYRTVFNLYAIDGYTHEQIAKKLNITEGGSKSNLFKARKRLRELIEKEMEDSRKVRSIVSKIPLLKVSR